MEYLIDIETLKKYSFIDGNVNDSILLVTLKRVQDLYVEPVLGTALYKRLLEGVANSDLTSNEDLLLEKYVFNYIYVACDIKGSTHLNWKIRNKSVGTANDEHVNANNVNDNNNLIDELRKDLSFYKNKLIGYLQDNKDLYPLYCDVDNCKKENIKPESKGTNYSQKISFI